MLPPSIIILTPNGRFKTNTKICLNVSDYHPETWRPSWSIRTVLLAIVAYMPQKDEGSIGALEYTAEERLKLAKLSHDWSCHQCGKIKEHLLESKLNEEDKELANNKSDKELSKTFFFKVIFFNCKIVILTLFYNTIFRHLMILTI